MCKQKRILFISFIIFLASILLPAVYLKAANDVTIQDIRFGELLMGEDYTIQDLEDHVVAIETWGKW